MLPGNHSISTCLFQRYFQKISYSQQKSANFDESFMPKGTENRDDFIISEKDLIIPLTKNSGK